MGRRGEQTHQFWPSIILPLATGLGKCPPKGVFVAAVFWVNLENKIYELGDRFF